MDQRWIMCELFYEKYDKKLLHFVQMHIQRIIRGDNIGEITFKMILH